MIEDLKGKFQLKLTYLFAPFAVICIGPIAWYRYIKGDYLMAAVDAAIVVLMLLLVMSVYWRRSARMPAKVVGVFYTTGAVLGAYFNNPFYIFWLYPAILANFYLLRPRLALTMNLTALAAVVPVALQTSDVLLTAGMMGSLLFSISMSFAFAQLVERQHSALHAAAIQDPLTGVGNRRLMDIEVDRSIDSAERHPSPMSLIVLDLDSFKAVNDLHGHKMGDQLLVAIANLLESQTRHADRVFRYGGEEFVVLAEHTPLEKAAVMAENLRQQIAVRIKTPDQPLTASFGCAQLEPGESAECWFGRADKALYRAKAQGRNCVVLAEE